MDERITINGIELPKRFLVELGRLALEWDKKRPRPDRAGFQSGRGTEVRRV